MIIVFAKAPVLGQVKTRLVAQLGEWGAARLHERLTLAALRTARDAGCGPVELHGTARHSFFSGKASFRLQRGRDLGERMHRSFSASLRCHRAVVLIGADCPALRPADLRRAARLLAGACDAVLAPAEDGGYALIALRKVSDVLFENISWGTPEVYSETLRRLSRLRYRWRALRTVWDVDRPEDLQRLTALRYFAARSRPARR